MNKLFFQIILLILFFLLGNIGLIEPAFGIAIKYSPYLQENNLSWSIAGDLQGKNPDVLSELTWRDVKMSGLRIELAQEFSEKVYLQSKVVCGLLFDGINQDSDYSGNGRTQEFSRSLNQIGMDYAMNGSMAVGVQILGNHMFELSSLGGYGAWIQRMRMINGEQLIPTTGTFVGLDSNYQMSWAGPWFGVKGVIIINPVFRVEGDYAYYLVNYDGVGNWNLRNDLMHPVSFVHHASGVGNSISFEVKYQMTRTWAIFLGGELSDWWMSPGYDQIFFKNGTSEITRLNQLKSKYVSLNFAINYVW